MRRFGLCAAVRAGTNHPVMEFNAKPLAGSDVGCSTQGLPCRVAHQRKAALKNRAIGKRCQELDLSGKGTAALVKEAPRGALRLAREALKFSTLAGDMMESRPERQSASVLFVGRTVKPGIGPEGLNQAAGGPIEALAGERQNVVGPRQRTRGGAQSGAALAHHSAAGAIEPRIQRGEQGHHFGA